MSAGAVTLPHSLDLERCVLNAALEWGKPIPAGLEPTHLFRHANTVIADACIEAVKRCLTPEYPIVRQILAERGHLDTVGAVYLNELARDGVRPSHEMLASAGQQLRRLHHKREAARLVLKYSADPGSVDLDQLAKDLQALRIAGTGGRRSSFRTAKDLAAAAERVEWLIRGFLAVGGITELTGKAKSSGKTTLVAFMVACLLDGLPCLGGTATAGPVVYLTEQTPATFREVLRRAGLLDRLDLSVLSYWDVRGQSWLETAELAFTEAQRIGARALVVDTISQFAGLKGEAENNSGDALEALAPLQANAARGLAVLVTRHERKGGGEVGESGRGSSAWTGGVDIVLSLRRPEGNHRPTMRVLESLSRFDETPARIVIEKAGKHSVHAPSLGIEVWSEPFVVLGDTDAVAHDEACDALNRHLPRTEDGALPMADLLSATGINRATLARALKADRTIHTTGKGRKGDPLRYFRPEIVCVQTSNPEGIHEQNPNEGYFRA